MKRRLIQLTITLVLLALLLSIINVRELAGLLVHSDPVSCLIALALITAQNVATARRWGIFLRAFRPSLRHLAILRMQYAALFAQLFLPTAIGGAAVRAVMAVRAGVSAGSAINAVVLDRIVSMTSLFVVGGICLPFAAISVTLGAGAAQAAEITAYGVAGGLVILVTALWWRSPAWWWALAKRTPVRPLLASLETAAHKLRRPATIFGAATYSLIGQGIAITAVFALATGAGLHVHFLDCLLVMPAVMILAALPISIAGWGVRESAMVVAFGFLGVEREPALALSVQYAAIGYLAALPGAAVWLMEANRGMFWKTGKWVALRKSE